MNRSSVSTIDQDLTLGECRKVAETGWVIAIALVIVYFIWLRPPALT